jgi:hypothetical protein
MITKTALFTRSHGGRLILFFLMASTLYTGYGCMAYKQVPIEKTEFMTHKRMTRDLASYTTYVHDGPAVYRMDNVSFIQNRDISGKLTATTFQGPQPEWRFSAKREWWKAHKYDIHLFTQDNANLAADLKEVNGIRTGNVLLKDAMIREIQVMGVDFKRSITAGNIVLALLGVYCIVAVAAGIVNSANGTASDGSDSDSGGSDSGNNSGS